MRNILVALLMTSTVMLIGQSKEVKKLEMAIEGLRKAMVEPTVANLNMYVMDGLSYGHSGGKIEDKASFVDNLVSGNSDFLDIELTDQEIQLYKKTAIVRHNLYAHTNDKGKSPSDVKLHIMTVWVKDHGNWKLLARQAIKKN